MCLPSLPCQVIFLSSSSRASALLYDPVLWLFQFLFSLMCFNSFYMIPALELLSYVLESLLTWHGSLPQLLYTTLSHYS